MLYIFFLGDSPACEFYMLKFRNRLCRLLGPVSRSIFLLAPPMKMEQCFETSTHKIQAQGNLPAYTTYEDGAVFRNVGA